MSSLSTMKLYCKCLNICIEIFGGFNTDKSLNAVIPTELISEEAAEVEVKQISYKLQNLLKEKTCGQLKICTCINCGQFAYASRKEGNGAIIVNKNLLSDPAKITELSLSENYSPAFQILLKQDDSITFEDLVYPYRLPDVATNWLKEELQRTEERIKKYRNDQYCAYDNHRIRAGIDNLLISRLIKEEKKCQPVNINSEDSKNATLSPKKTTINKSVKEETIQEGVDSVMFPLDDFENPLLTKDYSDGLSDVTEEEEDIGKMPHWKCNASNLARSCPIPVPQYVHDMAFDNKSNGSPPVPTDIAASIRALAKSVHGDSVFGELPRPRFRNQL